MKKLKLIVSSTLILFFGYSRFGRQHKQELFRHVDGQNVFQLRIKPEKIIKHTKDCRTDEN